jgi:arylsulfatase A-like enzyme
MFTGLAARTHGATFGHMWLDDHFVTLPEWLQSKGYVTWAFSANPLVSTTTNLVQGFDAVHHPWQKRWRKRARKQLLAKLLPNDRSSTISPKYVPGPLHREEPNSRRVTDSGTVAAAALSQALKKGGAQQPFFAFINYMEAHVPRVPTLAARQALFDEATIERQLALDQSHTALLAHTVGADRYTNDELQTAASTYDATLRDLDGATRDLFEVLDNHKVTDNTLVIITSDHGEHLGEHGRMDHKFSLYQPLVHVPLILCHADIAPGRVAEPVSTRALFGTIAAMLGEPPPSGVSGDLRDPSGAVFTELRAIPVAHLQHVEDRLGPFDRTPFELTWQAVVDGSDKLLRDRSGESALYDVHADPLETRNAAADRSERVTALTAVLDAWVERTSRAPERKRKTKRRSKQFIRQLEALGYVDE